MKAERRTIIVREIEHWRRSKLLPDHYCDFLLNLYADPVLAPKSEEEQPKHLVGKAIMAVSKATGKQWFYTIGFFTLISFIVLYFSVFHPALQISIILLGTFALLWFGEKIRKQHAPFGFLAIFLGHLLLLCGGLYLISQHQLSDWYWTFALIAVCSLFWIVYGMKSHLSMLHICGWLAFLLAYAMLLHELTSGQQWYEIQLYWIPLSILFFWISWFIHRWFKPSSAVLFVIGIATWFMPEIFQLVFIGEMGYLQLQLISKVIIGSLLLFVLRKQWMVWVI